MNFPVQQQTNSPTQNNPPIPSGADTVALYDASFNQVFEMARAVKANINVSSKLLDHPVENGATMTDFRIALPTEIELSVICTGKDYRTLYQAIRDTYANGISLILVTKADTYYNLMIQAMPHEETPDMFDVLAVAIKLREVMIIDTIYQPFTAVKVKKATDVSTVKTGETAPAPDSSYLNKIMTYSGTFLH